MLVHERRCHQPMVKRRQTAYFQCSRRLKGMVKIVLDASSIIRDLPIPDDWMIGIDRLYINALCDPR